MDIGEDDGIKRAVDFGGGAQGQGGADDGCVLCVFFVEEGRVAAEGDAVAVRRSAVDGETFFFFPDQIYVLRCVERLGGGERGQLTFG